MKAISGYRARKTAGFTLIEMMTAVLVAAILVGIAIPSYTAQTQKSRRTDAKTALLDLAAREERYNSTYNTYTSVPANLGYSGTFPVTIGSGYYQISVCVANTTGCTADAGAGSAFLLTATPIAAQVKDTTCASFKLDSQGIQTVTGSAASTPATCWN
jgi:type IV pilus assembly protein PilE